MLNLLLEITFETSVDMKEPLKLLIKRFYSLAIYLKIVLHLAQYSEWRDSLVSFLNSLYNIIKDSYANYCGCGKVFM